MPALRIGTRASKLAQWQAHWVAGRLRDGGIDVEIVWISTRGDQTTTPIGSTGEQGLFTKEIQRALLAREVDLAVHSLKDLPTDAVPGLTLAAAPTREAAGDALVCRGPGALLELPPGASIGTGSLRRQAQLLHLRPDLQVREIRGNVDTRLQKLDDGQYDALVLAQAGLRRLELSDRISELISLEVLLPAVGQGALGLECREEDAATRSAAAGLNDPETLAAVTAERALLRTLRGGCLAPVGAWGRMNSSELQLDAVVLSRDGSRRISATGTGDPLDAELIGIRAAESLLEQGAAALIEQSRGA